MENERQPLIRLGCAICRRFFLKTAIPKGVPLLVIPCPNCKKVNLYIFDEGTLYYMAVNAKDVIEPEGSVSSEQLAVIKGRCKEIRLTVSETQTIVI